MGGGPRFQAPFSAALLVLKGSWSGLEMGPRWVAPPKRGCSSAPPSPPPRPVRLSSRPCVTWLSLKAKIPTSPSRKHLSLADISVPSIRAAASPSFPLAGKRSPMGSSHPQPPPPGGHPIRGVGGGGDRPTWERSWGWDVVLWARRGYGAVRCRWVRRGGMGGSFGAVWGHSGPITAPLAELGCPAPMCDPTKPADVPQ